LKYIFPFLALFLLGFSELSFIEVEPQYKKTFAPFKKLSAGDKIRVDIQMLGETERLQFHLCGEECNSAKEVSSFGKNDVLENDEIEFIASKAGEYYFWLKETKGQAKAVPVKTNTLIKGRHVLIFESGSKITFHPILNLTSL
jgi:hypothetical protein